MKATKITYERVFNIGNYQSERVGIELTVEEGEKAGDVLRLARLFAWENRPTSGIEYARLMPDTEVITDIGD